jgi:16S rRNA (guanine(1405)-N(7))-methyltransferase
MSPQKSSDLESLMAQLRAGKTYKGLDLPEETLRDLLALELSRYQKPAEALKSARAKLHNVMAPYLGDLDYAQAAQELQAAFAGGQPAAVRDTCRAFLQQHDSTRERLAYLEDFYKGIFSICGQPGCLLDLACGLNPFALPWMGLPADARFYAYDIHPARIALINEFLRLSGCQPLAEVRDFLVRPPQVEADAAFLFKEAHRLEKRRKGCNRALWAALKVKYLFVSLPKRSLDGKRDLRERMRGLVADNLNPTDWEAQGELDFPGETVYWMKRHG